MGFLVLTRRTEEQIVIGGDIFLTVIWMYADKVKIMFECPEGVNIDYTCPEGTERKILPGMDVDLPVGEHIMVDGYTMVKLIQIRSGQARLGFDAPADVDILRKEIFDRGVTSVEPGHGALNEKG